MEDKDLIGKEFEFFEYKNVPHLKWGEEYAKWLGFRCVATHIHFKHKHLVGADVYPSIGRKFTKHFPIDEVKDQIEKNKRDSMSIEDILSEVKQLTSQI